MAERGLYVTLTASFARNRDARALLRRRGMEGLGQYVALMSLLLGEDSHSLDVTGEGLDDLAEELRCGSREECSELLADMAEAGVVDASALADGRVMCPAVERAGVERERLIEARREAGRLGAERRWGSRRKEQEDSKPMADL